MPIFSARALFFRLGIGAAGGSARPAVGDQPGPGILLAEPAVGDDQLGGSASGGKIAGHRPAAQAKRGRPCARARRRASRRRRRCRSRRRRRFRCRRWRSCSPSPRSRRRQSRPGDREACRPSRRLWRAAAAAARPSWLSGSRGASRCKPSPSSSGGGATSAGSDRPGRIRRWAAAAACGLAMAEAAGSGRNCGIRARSSPCGVGSARRLCAPTDQRRPRP